MTIIHIAIQPEIGYNMSIDLNGVNYTTEDKTR